MQIYGTALVVYDYFLMFDDEVGQLNPAITTFDLWRFPLKDSTRLERSQVLVSVLSFMKSTRIANELVNGQCFAYTSWCVLCIATPFQGSSTPPLTVPRYSHRVPNLACFRYLKSSAPVVSQ